MRRRHRSKRLLDLFCGAGGASAGYWYAGYTVTGVDLHPQPHYPFTFYQADALTFPLDGYDLIHASPPCQRYSRMMSCRPGLSEAYPDLIGPVRQRLSGQEAPYVIENVPGAPLHNPVMLCGAMFGYPIYRHRMFEISWPLKAPGHPRHDTRASRAGHYEPGTFISVAGHFGPMTLARAAMDIEWMNAAEMAESIPPYFTEYIGTRA
jgi:DNA (cytosine-5)-methyltransferase 1